jgi:hypothetical protein
MSKQKHVLNDDGEPAAITQGLRIALEPMIKDLMRRIAGWKKYGKRFKPTKKLKEMAAEGKSFYQKKEKAVAENA